QVLEQLRFCRALRLAVRSFRKIDLRVHIFGIDGDDLPAVDLEQLHPVRVLAEDLVRHVNGDATFWRVTVCRVRKQRITPAGDGFPLETFRHLDQIIGSDIDWLELEAGSSLRLYRCRVLQESGAEHCRTRT